MRSRFRFLTLLLSIALPAGAAPTTPTFLQAWGSAGSAPGQFLGPGGTAVDADGNVYVTDSGNHRVQKFSRSGALILTWGSFGTGDGQFNGPWGIAVDRSGNVYVGDLNNHRIEKFTSQGVFLTKWGAFGSGNGQFNGPYGVATDADGNVYVSDNANSRVQKFSSSGSYLAQWGSVGSGDGQLSSPYGVATDPAGNVYVADYNNNRIQKFSGSGTFLLAWGSPGSGDGQFNGAYAISCDPVGNVHVVELAGNRVQKFDAQGAFLAKWGSGGGGNGQFDTATGIASDAASNLFVADFGNHRVQRFSSAGATFEATKHTFAFAFGSQGSGNGQFLNPVTVATDAGGNVYVAGGNNPWVQKLTPAGGFILKWGTNGTGNGQFGGTYGVATDAAGNVYVVDHPNNRIQKFTSAGAYLAQWGSGGNGNGQFALPLGVAVDPSGNVYVTDANNSRVQKFTSNGAYLTQWGTAGNGPGQFNGLNLIAADATGVYVTETGNDRVQKFSFAGAFITQWGTVGNGPGQFTDPEGIAVDPAGHVYVADANAARIQKFTNTGTFLAQWNMASGTNTVVPQGLAVDAQGSLYAVDWLNHRVQKFGAPPSIGVVADVGNDQGRQARIRILRASLDVAGSGAPITGYEVYRRVNPFAAPLHGPVSFARVSTPHKTQLAGWTWLLTVPAHGESEYNAVVPTTIDANASSLEFSSFFVRAATSDPFLFYDSITDHGYSIDNLPPPTPSPFNGFFAGSATYLSWGGANVPDLAGFRLYRGASADFVPGPVNLLVETSNTQYADSGPSGGYYKLAAVDWNGNVSPFAVLTPAQTLDAPGDRPWTFALSPIQPNPTRSGALVAHVTLPVAGHARIELIDASGRKVAGRTLATAGAHAVDFTEGGRRLEPGLYWVRLVQGRQSCVRRVVVVE